MVWRPVFRLFWDMENFEEKICSCALNRIFGFSPKTGLALISHIGCASDVFKLTNDDLERLLGAYSKYRGQICWAAADNAEKELEKLERSGIEFIGYTENNYPALLLECEDAPIGLYIRSRTPLDELWAPRRRIAVVGTRDISPYGKDWCAKVVSGLSSSTEMPAIVSGLAIGTDYHAHMTALECGLPTIGVMATGPDDIYPYRHRELAERMCRTPGCALITDYPPGTPPLGIHFLRRNRIIAGLSDSTIVIESKLKGGAMMTSRLAFSYSRDVYALPGRADDIRSQGCNHLIRSKMAEPITSVDDLLASLDMKSQGKPRGESLTEAVRRTYGTRMFPEQIVIMNAILDSISGNRGITIDEIASATGLPYREISITANILETDGFISIDLLQRCTLNFKE